MPGCAAGGAQNRSHGWRGSKGTDRSPGCMAVPGVLGSSPHSGSTPTRGLSWGCRGSGQKQSLQPLQAVHSVAPARARVLPGEAPGQWPPVAQVLQGSPRARWEVTGPPGLRSVVWLWKAHLEPGQGPDSLSAQGTLQAVGPACLPGGHPVLCPSPSRAAPPAVTHPTGLAGHLGHAP